ncbi:hypothetical protein P154DRAFT_114416 [Amniculicola lignicola CBS 123094]|uniref:Uncharacterized protein n=1 Tax=Amniculicola lignicola CBS 123094 TaxID=1392246 RepID=A0A6A5WZA7_9PLEO|nr:hypothetical protein P154DRAFT_114416 [Amniculicola lignicola CBS 123094]
MAAMRAVTSLSKSVAIFSITNAQRVCPKKKERKKAESPSERKDSIYHMSTYLPTCHFRPHSPPPPFNIIHQHTQVQPKTSPFHLPSHAILQMTYPTLTSFPLQPKPTDHPMHPSCPMPPSTNDPRHSHRATILTRHASHWPTAPPYSQTGRMRERMSSCTVSLIYPGAESFECVTKRGRDCLLWVANRRGHVYRTV